MRWFVTGAGGQLATAFERLLDGEVFLAREEALDIRDAAAVATAVHGFGPDVVLHTAAYTDVDGAEADEQTAFAVNALGTRNVRRRGARHAHAGRVASAPTTSSTAPKASPYVESDAPSPVNAYGRTKLAGEQETLAWLRGIVIRTSWLFSATGANFVKTILTPPRSARRADRASRCGSSTTRSARPPTPATWRPPSTSAAPRPAAPGIYHMAGGGYCSWCELAREVVQLAGLDVEVVPITTAEARPAGAAAGLLGA